jgi:hypothetical protein
LYDEYFEHECTHNISPVILLSSKRLLRVAVERYCDVLPALARATTEWQTREATRRANARVTRASSSEMQRVMHARAFWDVVNSCCFIDGQVLFESGVLPDICERHVIPALLACRVMVSKSGHRKYRVTPKQTGVIHSRIFEFVDTEGHCAAIDPAVLCRELASRADLPAALYAAVSEVATLSRLEDWETRAILLHNSIDVKERLYPSGSSVDAPPSPQHGSSSDADGDSDGHTNNKSRNRRRGRKVQHRDGDDDNAEAV